MLAFHFRQSLPSGLFLLGFSTAIYAFSSPVRAVYPAYPILPHLTYLNMLFLVLFGLLYINRDYILYLK
jgi:hypothetical protein